MRKNENVEQIFMSIDEIVDTCKHAEENRNHYLDEAEATKHGYSKNDVLTLNSRVRSYIKNIFKKTHEWSEASPMLLYEIDGELYIVDGQGRFEAVKLYNQQTDENNPPIYEIPVCIHHNKTYDEMKDKIKELNQTRVNWRTEEFFRFNLMASGDKEKAEEVNKQLCAICDELGVKMYTAKLILFGYNKASHRDTMDQVPELNPYHHQILNAYRNFYNISIPSCDGRKREIGTLKNQCVAMSFYTIMTKVISICNKENIDTDKKLDKASRILGEFAARMDRTYKFAQVFGGRTKSITSNFAVELKRRTKDVYLSQVANSFSV